MTNATLTRDDLASMPQEQKDDLLLQLYNAVPHLQRELADVQRKLATQQAEKVGWRMTGVALAFLVSLDIGIAGYTFMYVWEIGDRQQKSEERILNNQEEILRRLPPR